MPSIDHLLTPEGKHTGTIRGFCRPKESQVKFDLKILPIHVIVAGQVLTYNVSGYAGAIDMLVKSEEFWIGKEVTCQVRHIPHPGDPTCIFPEVTLSL